MLEDDYTLEDCEIENEAVLRIEIKGRAGIKFNSMEKKIIGKGEGILTVITDLNKHTFLFDGVNLKGTCEEPDCAIKSILQNF